MEKYYGFHYWGDQINHEKAQTFLPVGQINLEGLLSEVKDYIPTKNGFTAKYGYIKELSMFNGEVKQTAPAKVGKEKYQAFIFKRGGDVIVKGDDFYTINAVDINVPLKLYDITILDI